MEQIVLSAVTSADNITPIAEDNLVFSFWKSENGLIIQGVSWALEDEVKRFAPVMYKIVKKYEKQLGKRKKDFNIIDTGMVNDEFYATYEKIKLGKLSYDDYIYRGIC